METLTFLPEFHRYWLGPRAVAVARPPTSSSSAAGSSAAPSARELARAGPARGARRARRAGRRGQPGRGRHGGAAGGVRASRAAARASASRAAAATRSGWRQLAGGERPRRRVPRPTASSTLALDATDARGLAARARWQRRLGLRVLDARRRGRPAHGPASCRRASGWRVHFPDDHRVNNERLGRRGGLAARRAGVTVLEHTRGARDRRPARPRHRRADRRRASIAAPVVVNAAGAWAAELRAARRASPPPPVFPVRGQMLVLRGAPGALALPLYTRRAYLVPRLDGRVLLGSTRERAGFEKRVTMGAAAALLAAAAAMAPGPRASERRVGAYAGLRPAHPTGCPSWAPARDLHGLFYATGLYRSGILLAPAVAAAVADLVVEGSDRAAAARPRPTLDAQLPRRATSTSPGLSSSVASTVTGRPMNASSAARLRAPPAPQEVRDLGMHPQHAAPRAGTQRGLVLDAPERVVRQRLHRAHAAGALAVRARAGEELAQALARALARHLDQAELRDAQDVRARLVARASPPAAPRTRCLRLAASSMSMKSITMMPPRLRRRSCADDLLRRFEVGAEDRLLLALLADVAAGVDVDGGQRLGLLDDEVAAGLEPHPAIERARRSCSRCRAARTAASRHGSGARAPPVRGMVASTNSSTRA